MRLLRLCLPSLAACVAAADATAQECFDTALALGPADDSWLLEFDRYHEFFDDDSVYLLPYTGAYIGADAIAEYVAFGAPGSVFFESQVSLDARYELGGISGPNCSFLLLRHAVVRAHAPARPVEAEFTSLIELIVTVNTTKVNAFNYYWHPVYQGLLNTFVFNTPEARSYVCGRVIACGYMTDEAACADRFAALPVVEGELNWADGNSQGCRYLHSTFTEVNPDKHCPHIAFEPTQDSAGAFKCQESEGIRPEDVFTQQQLDLHTAYSRERGLPPGGFAFRCTDHADCPPDYACAAPDARRRLLFGSLPAYAWCVPT